jgi:hypothetical protein
MVSSVDLKRRLRRIRLWARRDVVGLLAAGIAVHTFAVLLVFWRYAFTPNTVSDPGDPLLLIWIMEWVQRALLSSPATLFDAPMFHPFTRTLAYSDPLIPQALAALPLRALGLGPVSAYNVVYLGGIVAAGVLTTLLFYELTGDRMAAIVGGLVATFPNARLFHLAHMQLQVTLFWPLVLLLVHRTLRQPDVRISGALALTLAATPLASLYHGLYMALLIPPFALALWIGKRPRFAVPLLHLAGAAAAASLLLVPFGRIYVRSLGHLGQSRNQRLWSQLSDYLGISQLADVGRWLPSASILREAASQWVGGGAAWLLPIALTGIGIEALRRHGRVRASTGLPQWARDCLPYAILGCLAIALSLGPRVRWRGHDLVTNPLSAVTHLPAVREIRNFQRLAFVVGLAGGALVAFGLAEAVRRKRRRLALCGGAFACVTTLLPSFSTSLPAYRPPPAERLPAVYQWLSKQPEPLVLYELPLPRHGEPMEYLWAAAIHRKRLIHGFSGYLPLTDLALRVETLGAHRPDFWRALALLGATHLVVHTEQLSALQGGATTLAELREFAGVWRIASFDDAEVYLVPSAAGDPIPADSSRLQPLLSSGAAALDGERRCLTIGPNTTPLLLYATGSSVITGVSFHAETPLGQIDDALLIERSADLSTFQAAPHRPLLSTSLSAYVRAPTPTLWARALVAGENGAFLRVSTRNRSSFRICDVEIDFQHNAAVAALSRRDLRVSASRAQELVALAIDGDPTTRWVSQRPQSGDEWLELELQSEIEIEAVLLDLGQAESDYGRKLVLDCGATSAALEPGPELDGRGILFERPRLTQVLAMAPGRRCRKLRIRQTGTDPDSHWSIAELSVFGRL